MQGAATAVKPREAWIDTLRGSAIVLVVLLHASEALDFFTSGGQPAWLLNFNEAFLPYRMPLLIFLSGIFLQPALKKGPRRYFLGKLFAVGWPYLIWSVLILLPAGDLNITTLGEIIYDPPTYLWFLWFLLGYYLIAYLTRPVPAWALILIAFAIAIFVPYYWNRFAFLFAFFIMGDWFARNRQTVYRLARKPLAIGLAAVLAIGFSVLAMLEFDVYYRVISFPGVLGVIILAIRFMPLIPDRLTRPLRYVGVNSLVFYVSHLIAIKIIAALMQRAGLDNVALMLPVLLAVGILTGYVLTRLRARYRPFQLMFELPRGWLGTTKDPHARKRGGLKEQVTAGS
jgi:uncharacterized membrane protein YcfT